MLVKVNFLKNIFAMFLTKTKLAMLFFVLFLVSFFSVPAFAYCFDDCVYQEKLYSGVFPAKRVYYVGLGYTQAWVPVRPPDWNRFFDKPHAGAGFYFGRRFCDRLGLEIGYEWNINKPLNTEVFNGTTLLTIPNRSGASIVVQGKCRFKTGYLDLHGFVPLFPGPYFECFRKTYRPEFIVLLGVANTKPKFNIKSQPMDSFFSPQIVAMSGRTKAVFRAGVGLQFLFWDEYGFRVMYRYQTTSALRARNGLPVIPVNQRIFRDSQSINFSLFMCFRPF